MSSRYFGLSIGAWCRLGPISPHYPLILDGDLVTQACKTAMEPSGHAGFRDNFPQEGLHIEGLLGRSGKCVPTTDVTKLSLALFHPQVHFLLVISL